MTEQNARSFLLLTHLLAELCSAENVEMKMLDRLTSIGTAVGDNAVSAAKIFSLGDLGNSLKDLCNESAVFRADLID